MKRTKNTIAILLPVIVIVVGCKSLKDPVTPDFAQMPNGFTANATDSSNTGVVTPRELFNDPLLVDLIDTILAHNLSLLRSETTLLQLEADVLEARTNLIPKAGAFAGYSNRKFGLHTMDGAGNITTPIGSGEIIPINLNDFNLGLQASWEIDIWGKLRAQRKAAAARFLAAKESQNMIKTWVIEQTVIHYFNLVSLDETKKIIEQNIELNTNLVDVLKEQKTAGRANQLSIQQFEALILNYSNQLILLEQEINASENELRRLSGKFDGEIKRSSLTGNGLTTLKIDAGLPSQIIGNRPDIRQAEQLIIASKADIKAARTAFYPSLSINGNIGYQAYKTRFLFSSPESIAYGLFGNLMSPLINRGELKANFKRATATQLDAYYGYQEVLLTAFTEVNNALFVIKNTDRMINNKKAEMDLLQSSREIAGELFNTNRANYVEVLFAQQAALSAELEFIELQKNQFTWKVYLYKSIGGGWK
jgi:NodT family efflux transporter outer membrane factor (OMF) lipoprotein